jgi:hypothetical protein
MPFEIARIGLGRLVPFRERMSDHLPEKPQKERGERGFQDEGPDGRTSGTDG